MSSLSLPRVLQNRKTSLEVERENFEKSQSISIAKAINFQETPVKEKHVRSAIIGTYQEKGGHTFWVNVLKLPLQDNRIVAWKFCHVLHKVLREGHPQVLADSQRHKNMIKDLGKLWCHLQEGYGKLIQYYTNLLRTKLQFHLRNPRFPGNLNVTPEELERIGENDINNYFEMAVEMFDYLDDILSLQKAIFGSLDMSRCNSMMSSGQCRLAPLIPCIQDSSRLYDFCVKILFKLHASLPPDTLVGHRERFLQQFHILREFYLNANMLQYFKTLIQITLLPSNPPNFLIAAELGTYVTPVVVMPREPEQPESTDGFLIDTSDMPDGHSSPEQSVQNEIREEQLIMEIRQLRNRLEEQTLENQRMFDDFSEKIALIQSELEAKEEELLQEKQLKEDLLRHTEEASKYHEYERRAQVMEDKFDKLKVLYSKRRDEHIALIRAKADVDRQLIQMKMAAESSARLREEMDVLLGERAKNEETESELTILRSEQSHYKAESQSLSAKLDWLTREKTELESDLQDLLTQKQNLDVRLQEALTEYQQKLKQINEQLLVLAAQRGEEEIKNWLEEMENPALSTSTSTPDYLRSLEGGVQNAVKKLSSANNDETNELALSCVAFAGWIGNFLIHCRTTANSSPDIQRGDKLADLGRDVGKAGIDVVKSINLGKEGRVNAGENLIMKLNALYSSLESLTSDSSKVYTDLVESEMADMEKAIEEAAAKIVELSQASRESNTGVKLEVNEKILESCKGLMAAILLLVKTARVLQAEVVAQGKGSSSAKEFYKRNHRWTEGLLSAAKAVASGATFLLSCADLVVKGEAKFEPLIVASQEIAASTVQLVVASRVKADRSSQNLSKLGEASRSVTQATAGVVAAAKSCSQLVEDDNEVFDTTKLTLHQTKRFEMESQVRVLELEASLQQERAKLAELRRRHYQLAEDMEGSAVE